jgi:5-methylcytosine-specific restriction endonuclease McrA
VTKRDEFSAKTKEKAYERSKGRCENKLCGLPLQIGKIHYDHIIPCRLGGTGEIKNCQVLCFACHQEKTAKEDIPRIAKATRQHRRHIGAVESKGTIKSRGFPDKKEKPGKIDKSALPPLPRRSLYQ